MSEHHTQTTVTWALGILGWVVSWALFSKWLAANHWDFFGGWASTFDASDFTAGLLSDLVVVTAMMVAVALFERRRLGPRWTTAVIAALGVSVSMSLAIYLVASWSRPGGQAEQP